MEEFKWINKKQRSLFIDKKLFDNLIDCFIIYEEQFERNEEIKDDLIAFIEYKWTNYGMTNTDFQYVYNLLRRLNK